MDLSIGWFKKDFNTGEFICCWFEIILDFVCLMVMDIIKQSDL